MDYGKNNTYPKYYFNKLIFVFSLIPCIVIVLAVTLLFGNTTKKQAEASVEGNMYSWTSSLGESLYESEVVYGNGLLYEYDVMDSFLKDIKIQDIDSSYCYVVNTDGTMLYHPSKDKVGQPVTNSLVKDLCAKMVAGNAIENDVTSYDYNGKIKYASYYVAPDNSFILVFTADKSEVLADANSMVLIGIIIAVVGVGLFAVLALVFVKKSVKPN